MKASRRRAVKQQKSPVQIKAEQGTFAVPLFCDFSAALCRKQLSNFWTALFRVGRVRIDSMFLGIVHNCFFNLIGKPIKLKC
ncbi:hypothetical protein EQM14_04220 [Caproiciproducens sp. NJN-50]|uniref:hypothetical protein n=1 Tax=Acutalibacteraceae TaxID=3082771 RepID=UPI000FFE2AE3|nr:MULTISPECIES: hypothetical protein [Acutalibacteraceae]QAT49041.1 hypothetical protein EQM14_04220 [Caproiciproducens sp. NJN-50]